MNDHGFVVRFIPYLVDKFLAVWINIALMQLFAYCNVDILYLAFKIKETWQTNKIAIEVTQNWKVLNFLNALLHFYGRKIALQTHLRSLLVTERMISYGPFFEVCLISFIISLRKFIVMKSQWLSELCYVQSGFST